MSASDRSGSSGYAHAEVVSSPLTRTARAFAWAVAATTLAYVLNAYLIFWRGWPGLASLFGGAGASGAAGATAGGADILGLIQAATYALSILGPIVYVARTGNRPLRSDAESLRAVVNYIIRVAFWVVVLVGLVDMVISFLRVEGMLESVVGAELTKELGRSRFRGPYVHMPLIGLAVVIGAFTRSLVFAWLAVLVVIAELAIVLSRFIFSYEQAFEGDLVRFWYAALFLFASAYTLFEDGHVRVDIIYSGFSQRAKGLVNSIGSLILGMPLCGLILFVGMSGKSSILTSPLVSYEISQSGYGMYVKYLMAGFLVVFAVSMMIQFACTFLEGIADVRDEPGRRKAAAEVAH